MGNKDGTIYLNAALKIGFVISLDLNYKTIVKAQAR